MKHCKKRWENTLVNWVDWAFNTAYLHHSRRNMNRSRHEAPTKHRKEDSSVHLFGCTACGWSVFQSAVTHRCSCRSKRQENNNMFTAWRHQILSQGAHFWIWSCGVFSLIQPQCSSQLRTSEWISWKVTGSKEDGRPSASCFSSVRGAIRKTEERKVQQSKRKKEKKEGSQ